MTSYDFPAQFKNCNESVLASLGRDSCLRIVLSKPV